MIGLSLSYNQAIENMPKVVNKLLKRELNSGELKFLEFITVYLDVTAPRYFWQQIDTYNVGIRKQSESTMHTILKRKLLQSDFEEPIRVDILELLNSMIERKEFDNVKNHLPESFLQRRIIVTNYKTLIHIIKQRKNHKLKVWELFCNYLIENLEQKHIIDALVVNYEMTKFSKQEMKWIKEYFDNRDFDIEVVNDKSLDSKMINQFLEKLKC